MEMSCTINLYTATKSRPFAPEIYLSVRKNACLFHCVPRSTSSCPDVGNTFVACMEEPLGERDRKCTTCLAFSSSNSGLFKGSTNSSSG